MPIELTEQQCTFLEEHSGEPVEFVDPQTNRIYVLVAREAYVNGTPSISAEDAMSDEEWLDAHVPPGVRRSQKALRRDLPELLKNKKLRDQWVAYHGDERVGIAKSEIKLTAECIKRGFKSDEYYVGLISHYELVEIDEIEPRLTDPW